MYIHIVKLIFHVFVMSDKRTKVYVVVIDIQTKQCITEEKSMSFLQHNSSLRLCTWLSVYFQELISKKKSCYTQSCSDKLTRSLRFPSHDCRLKCSFVIHKSRSAYCFQNSSIRTELLLDLKPMRTISYANKHLYNR